MDITLDQLAKALYEWDEDTAWHNLPDYQREGFREQAAFLLDRFHITPIITPNNRNLAGPLDIDPEVLARDAQIREGGIERHAEGTLEQKVSVDPDEGLPTAEDVRGILKQS
jgi:hypothetical protein